MNSALTEKLPKLIHDIWDYYSVPRREHLVEISKDRNATIYGTGLTCRALTEQIDNYIIEYPEEAIKHRIVVWYGLLMAYSRSAPKDDPQQTIYVSCHGRAYQKQEDGSFVELPHQIVTHGSNSYWRYPLPNFKGYLGDLSEDQIDNYSLAPHRIVCYWADNPMPKMWSKLFDTLRNGIPKNCIQSGGDYYFIDYGQVTKKVRMKVTINRKGKVYPRFEDTNELIKHRADHKFNDTAQEPGVHMWFDCQLVLEDINRINRHKETNDKDYTEWPLQAGFGPQRIQYKPWCYMEYTQCATHDPLRFDRTGDRAIRYYQQMVQQYFDCIDAGCPEIKFEDYDWCEAMK